MVRRIVRPAPDDGRPSSGDLRPETFAGSPARAKAESVWRPGLRETGSG